MFETQRHNHFKRCTTSKFHTVYIVVLNHCSESCKRLPSTFFTALSSLSTKPLIFCATDFVVQQNVSFLHYISSVQLCNKVVS